MPATLALGKHAVVTTYAVSKDSRMINRRAQPGGRVVTGFARIGRRNMVRRHHMATGAATNDLKMIHGNHRCPGGWGGIVAGIAHIRGINMISGLAVTTGADADDLGVIYRAAGHRRPGGRELGMTGIAHITGIDMR